MNHPKQGLSPLKQALLAIERLEGDLKRERARVSAPIAVVGMGCRFPGGANSPALYRALLREGRDCIREVPGDRWDLEAFYDSDPEMPGKMYCRHGSFLDGVRDFDPWFFKISPREAAGMDPQQRLLLEVGWEALEDAFLSADKLRHANGGVFVGVTTSDYSRLLTQRDLEKLDASYFTGNPLNTSAARLAYLLGWHGPAVALDTACSSSLVSVHLACQALRSGECDIALAGGVNLILAPDNSVAVSRTRALSPTGRCHTFDAAADGFVRGEGCGLVVLKRLDEALRDGNRIWTVVQGSAVNQDGGGSGFTVPNGQAQQRLIVAALKQAGINPAQVGYVEAHGTGTALGDPIETKALGAVLGPVDQRDQPVWLASVKTNFGHLESAAGIAGLIKAALAVHYGEIYPHLHFRHPSPHIPWEQLPFKVPTRLEEWSQARRFAGVSAFGAGGTNAHLILGSPPLEHHVASIESTVRDRASSGSIKSPDPSVALPLLTLNGHHPDVFPILAQRYLASLSDSASEDSWRQVCAAANRGRAALRYRWFATADNLEKLKKALQDLADQKLKPREIRGMPTCGWLFSGQGNQYPGMGRYLYENMPVARQVFDRLEGLAQELLKTSLLEVLLSENEGEKSTQIHKTAYTQPCLYALETALAATWRHFGLEPDLVLGHSVGAYAAAQVAGIFSLEDGFRLIAARAKGMQALPCGAMTSVFAPEELVAEQLRAFENKLDIAAFNGPEQIVVSGQPQAMDALHQQLQAAKIRFTPLQVSHAFHSPMMDPMLETFKATAVTISYRKPQVPFLSDHSGSFLEQAPDAAYWTAHIRRPVQFTKAISAGLSYGATAWLELGPHPTLCAMAQQADPVASQAIWIASLNRKKSPEMTLAKALGQLYCVGQNPNWARVYAGIAWPNGSLPTYPYQRKTYWIPEGVTMTQAPGGSPLPKQVSPVAKLDQQEIMKRLRDMAAEALEAQPEEVNVALPFLEMGADSIVMVEIVRIIQSEFGVRLAVRQFFEELSTIEEVAAYLVEHADPQVMNTAVGGLDEAPQANPVASTQTAGSASFGQAVQSLPQTLPPMPSGVPSGPSDGLQALFREQLDVMRRQLALVGGSPAAALSSSAPAEKTVADAATPAAASGQTSPKPAAPLVEPAPSEPKPASLPPWKVAEIRARGLTDQQKDHLEALIARLNAKTAGSKAFAEKARPVLADNRASAGFRFSTKELLYPIVGKSAKGAHMTDIDGNKYVDITMGFGVNLFGHHPDFVAEAVSRQVQAGYQLGPQAEDAAEVARLFCQLTGMDRLTFCNTGTEAVMTALRIARTVTKRPKIALFSSSYHGHFDGVLGDAMSLNSNPHAIALAPGVTQHTVDDVLVLDYGNPQSLDLIKTHAHELAAVLTEPVQSRRPNLQPQKFLVDLRELTAQEGIALIFDEVITGFRIHPGGAQAHFGIEADLATYGKIVGGGLPIGVVAGRKRFMDAIDGGMWQYGDASYPTAETTFFAGTFCKHPLSMAAAKAVLSHLEEAGPALQQGLTDRTANLAERLNELFKHYNAPVEVVHFGSLFRFVFRGNMDLLFYHLLDQGVYIWEGRNFFICTEHSDADLDFIVAAVERSIEALAEGGFIGKPKGDPDDDGPSGPKKSQDTHQNKTQNQIRTPTNAGVPEASPESSAPGVSAKVATPSAPLNQAQRQLWVLDQLDPAGSAAYGMHAGLDLKGRLDMQVLQAALDATAARHEALRARVQDEGETWIIDPPSPVQMEFRDLSKADADTRQVVQEAFRAQRFPFDKGPLFRVACFKMGPDHHQLVLSVHHIVADGWSMGVLSQDLATAYNSIRNDQQPEWKPSLSFSQHLQAFHQRMQADEMRQHRDYWLQHLGPDPQPVLLPTDYPRGSGRKGLAGARRSLRLEPGLVRTLQTFASAAGATRFMLMFAAFRILLDRLTGSHQNIVGIPVAGRSIPKTKHTVTYCTHLMPFCKVLSPQKSVTDYVKAVKSTLLDNLEHQEYPYAQLIQDVTGTDNQLSRPLVNTVFNMESQDGAPKLHGLEVSQVEEPVVYSAFDLCLHVTESGSQIILDADYAADYFEAATIAHWLEVYRNLLETMVQQPEMPVRGLSLLSREQRRTMLEVWNAPTAPLPEPSCIHHFFEQQADQNPDNIALLHGDERLTYGDLEARSNQVAHYLIKHGVGPEVAVGLCFERGTPMVIAILGVLKAGGMYVPIDPDFPVERVAHIAQSAGFRLLLTEKKAHCDVLQVSQNWNQDIHQMDLDAQVSLFQDQPKDRPQTGVTPQNGAYVLYTSGSTGVPKGVLIHHREIAARMVWEQQTYQLRQGDCLLQKTSYCFDVSLSEFFWPWLVGACTLIPDHQRLRDSAYLAQMLAQHNVAFLHIVPSHLESLLDDLEPQLCERLRVVIAAGEALPANTVQRFYQKLPHVRLENLYGPTEASIYASGWSCSPSQTGSVPIGRPLNGTRLYICDADLQPVPVGAPGELMIGGLGLARGYFGQPKLTAAAFVPDPFSSESGARMYRTGDLVRYRADGTVDFLGRIDFQVKIRGLRVELEEVERAILKHPQVSQAVAMVRPNAAGEPVLVGYIIPAANTQPDPTTLRRFLSEKLPEYMLPSVFINMAQFPTNSSEKLDRKAFPPIVSINTGVEPLTPTQKMLVTIWQDVLQLQEISCDQSFFQLGGHSLSATKVLGRIEAQTGKHLELSRFFAEPTIANLAQMLEQDVTQRPEPRALSAAASYPLSSSQKPFWIQDRMLGPSGGVPAFFEIQGPINVEKLRKCLRFMVASNHILRARFEEQDGRGRMVIEPPESWHFDLKLESAAGRTIENVTKVWREKAFQAPFDLTQGPLLRFQLARFDDQHHLLGCCMHHIITDGVSAELFLQELVHLYNQEQPRPMAKAFQYSDFTAWQEALQESVFWQRARDFWKNLQLGQFPQLQLVGDRDPSRTEPYQVKALYHAASDSKLAPLWDTGRLATSFVDMLTAYSTTLYRHSGETRLIIGTPTAGRNHAAWEHVMGPFLNLLPIPVNLEQIAEEANSDVAQLTLSQLKSYIAQEWRQVQSYADFPFEKLQQLAEIPKQQSLFKAGITLQSQAARTQVLADGTRIAEYFTPGHHAMNPGLEVDWWPLLTPRPDKKHLECIFTYDARKYEPQTIETTLQDFLNVLKATLIEPDTPLKNIQLGSQKEPVAAGTISIDLDF